MKYAARRKKKAEPLNPAKTVSVVSGSLFLLLPLVASFYGFDTFRSPKEVAAFVGIALLVAATGFVAARLPFGSFFCWEGLLLAGLLWSVASALWSAVPLRTLQASASVLAFVTLIFCCRYWLTGRAQRITWTAVAVVMGLNGLVTMLQYYGLVPVLTAGGELLTGRITPAGLIGEVNSGGFLFGLAIVVLIPRLATEKSGRLKAFLAVVLAANLVGLAYTRTLTAIVALAVSLGLFVLFHHWWVFRFQERRLALRFVGLFWLAMAGGLAAGVWVASEAGVVDRIGTVLRQAREGNLTVATAGRQPVYSITWRMIQENPWLGRGLDTFGQDFFHARADTDYGQSVQLINQPGAFRQAHNEYLQVWLELGVVGLLLFLALLLIPMFRTLPLLRGTEDPEKAYWVGGLVIGIAFVAVSSLTFFPFQLPVTAAYIVLLYAGLRYYQSGEALVPVRKVQSFKELWNGRSAWIRALAAVLLIVPVSLTQLHKWQANNEIAVSTYLLEQVSSAQVPGRARRLALEEALRRLNKAESLYPRFYEISNFRGTAYLLMGRYEQARDEYERAAEILPSPEIYTNLAAAYMALEELGEARAALERALRYNPSYSKARQALDHLNSTSEGG